MTSDASPIRQGPDVDTSLTEGTINVFAELLTFAGFDPAVSLVQSIEG